MYQNVHYFGARHQKYKLISYSCSMKDPACQENKDPIFCALSMCTSYCNILQAYIG